MNYEPFPTELLPHPVRALVEDGAKAIGCEPAYIALPTLSGLASAIGNARRVRLKRSWSEPAILWTAVIGESGTAKSPAIELALRPIKQRQDAELLAYMTAMTEYERDAERHATQHKAWLKRAGHPTNPGTDDPPVAPTPPTCERTWTDDATTEAMVALLADNQRGLLLASDELAGWFKRMDAYKSGKGADAARWLEMHGARSVVVDRRGAPAIHVPRAAVSVCGGIQPAILSQVIGDTNRENGMLARILLACPPRRPKRWSDSDIDPGTLEAVGAVYDGLYGLPLEQGPDGQDRPGDVVLAPEARERFIAFYDAHNAEQAALDGDEASAWSKLEGYAARIALVIHLARYAAGERIDPRVIDAASMEAAIGLVGWFGREARRIYARFDESEGQARHRELLEAIERNGGTMTTRELQTRKRAHYPKAEDAQDALDGLVYDGVAEWEHLAPGPYGGRRTKRLRLLTHNTQPREAAPEGVL